MSSPELEKLLGPLTFAAKNDFAGLERVRGLEALVLGRIADARAEGTVDSALLNEMAAAAAGMDELVLEQKKSAVTAVVDLLGRCVALPERLLDVAGQSDRCRGEDEGSGGGSEPSERRGGALSCPSPSAQGPKCAGQPPPSKRSVAAKMETSSDESLLDTPVSSLPGVGSRRARAFSSRGVKTVRDALWFLPVGYERRVSARCMADLEPGSKATVRGRVLRAGERMLGRGRRVFEAIVIDDTGRLRVRYYRSGPWLARRFPEDAVIGLSGPVRAGRDMMLEMAHPDLLDPKELEEGLGEPDCVVPRYSEIEGVPPKVVRDIVGRAVEHAAYLPETLPSALVEKRELMSPGEAVRSLHRPCAETSIESLEGSATEAHRRLAFEELFFLQLGLALKARGVKVEPGIAFPVDESSIEDAVSLLPFEPTSAQARSIREIAADMSRPEPMHRLLQGDVGSGKTAVAVAALAMAVRAGWQGAVMAPTELLAEQHYKTLAALLEIAGIEVVLLAGKLRASKRREALAAVSEGRAGVAVGTQALIQDGVDFQRLGLVVVDEQHRFGVRQRATLIEKGLRPDTLVMTATPIPRTLAMTAYGDLDLSLIDELPPGRTPVATKVFKARDRQTVWAHVREHVVSGRQAFIVYPIVETSEHMEEVAAATEMAEELDADVFPDLRVGLVHGRMSAEEKDEVMGAFAKGEISVLVATTVVEVGIDVPNATVMVVEHAERFGLSQLHQLRGRVGRGAGRSYCYLVAHEIRGEKVRDRLGVMARTCDGFLIAEEDLRIRGPGEVLGTRQSGHPDLLFGNLARDRAILAQAREDAFALVEADPHLTSPEHETAAREVLARWGGRIQLGRVG